MTKAHLPTVVLAAFLCHCPTTLMAQAFGGADKDGSAAEALEEAGEDSDQIRLLEDEGSKASKQVVLDDVHALSFGPGCLSTGGTNINALTALFDHFSQHPGRFFITSSGFSTLSSPNQVLFPESDLSDGTLVSTFLGDPGATTREVLEESFPVLDTPWEITFQIPFKGHFDWLAVIEEQSRLQGIYPDLTRRTGTLVRYTNSRSETLLALEYDEPGALMDVLSYTRQFSASSTIQTEDDKVQLYSFGRQIGRGSSLKAAVDKLRAALPVDRTLVLHRGGVSQDNTKGELAFCGDALSRLGVDAIAPHADDLLLGVDKLLGFAKAHKLPFVAANLRDARKGPEDPRPFPRFVIKDIGGLKIAIVGLVGREQLVSLPASVRSQWSVESPGIAFGRTARALNTQLGKRPDLTIVLASVHGDDLAMMLRQSEADIIVSNVSRLDLVGRRVTVEMEAGAGSRERSRYPRSAVNVFSSFAHLDHITASFEIKESARARLARVLHESRAILEGEPRDAALDKQIRVLEEQDVERDSSLMLPDPAPIVEKRAELQPMVWGERIPHRGGFRRYERSSPARFSDPLWMRFVTNVLREELDVDVAVVRNIPRGFDMIGPLSRLFVENWLSTRESLRVVSLTGSDLKTLAARIRRQRAASDADSADYIYAAGLNPDKLKVAGRSIVPGQLYRVVTTDSTIKLDGIGKVFAGKSIEPAFSEREEGGWVEDAKGSPVLVGRAMMAFLERWLDPATRRYKPAFEARFESLLLDHSGDLEGRWLLAVEALSLTGSLYTNTDNIALFAETKETRVTTPDNTSLGARANIALIYDGPSLAWENRVKTALQRLILDIPGADIPPQEQADDVLAFTELRFNAVRLEVGAEAVQIVPFVRSTLDTEFTATPNPQSDDPDATFPHQLVLRQSLGFVAYPGPRLKEIRLGGLFQSDITGREPHNDLGLTAGYKLALPLFGPTALTSEADLRFLVPDDDDRATDLGLVLSSSNKFVVSLGHSFSLFTFADLHFVQGKLNINDEIGGSWILGGGLQFSRSFRL